MDWKIKNLGGKRFSHRRSNFPFRLCPLHGGAQKRVVELKAQEMVAVAVRDPHDFRAKVLGTLRDGRGSGQGGAGDFERNLRRWPKSAVHCHERTPG